MRADVDPMGFGIYKSASVLGLAVAAEHPRREDQRRVPAAGRAGPAGPRGLSQRRSREEAIRTRYRDYIAQDAHARRLRSRGRTRERGAGAGNGASRKATARARRRQTTTMPTTSGRVPTSRSGLPGWTGPSSSTGRGWPRQGEFVVWQPTRRDRVGGAGRVAAAGGLEGLPALPCHPRFRGRAAARIRRGGAGDACGDGAGSAAIPRRARARCHAIGHERRAREDVRQALFPRRAEGARRANLRQRPRGAHRSGSRPRRGCRRPPKPARC